MPLHLKMPSTLRKKKNQHIILYTTKEKKITLPINFKISIIKTYSNIKSILKNLNEL